MIQYDHLVALFLISAAVSTLSVTLTQTELLEPSRDWLLKKSDFLYELSTCPYCAMHWVSLTAVLLFQYRPVVTELWLLDYAVSVGATVCISSVLGGLIYRLFQ